jgi:hypothetical protein
MVKTLSSCTENTSSCETIHFHCYSVLTVLMMYREE